MPSTVGCGIVEAFVDRRARRRDDETLVARLADAGVSLVEVAGAAEARLAYGDRRSEVVAVVVMPPTDLERLAAGWSRTSPSRC